MERMFPVKPGGQNACLGLSPQCYDESDGPRALIYSQEIMTDSFVKNLRRRGTTVCDNANPRSRSTSWSSSLPIQDHMGVFKAGLGSAVNLHDSEHAWNGDRKDGMDVAKAYNTNCRH